MKSLNKQELFEYYDAKAHEYEEFTDGRTATKTPAPVLEEVEQLKELLPDYVGGRCIDIACGTGFWLPFYHMKCDKITLIDQSQKVLEECNKKIIKLGIKRQTEVICDDIFSYALSEQIYDTAITALLISHLTNDDIDALVPILKKILVPGGKFIIMDKAWNVKVAATCEAKYDMEVRTTKDGRQFTILNRHFERHDLEDIAARHNFNLDIVYCGDWFFLATGYFQGI